MRSFLSLGLFVVCALGTGCTSIQSSDLKTGGMTATMTVAADDTGLTKTTVVLNVDNNGTDFVSLSGGDSLAATAGGGAAQVLSEDSLMGDINYVASFNGENAGGTPYVVAFNRASDVSAPSSLCTLPAPFAISGPAAGTSFSRSTSDITITYGPSGTGDAVSYSVQGACVNEIAGAAVSGDPGVIVIKRGALVAGGGAGQGGVQSGACGMTVTVVRQRQGAIDPHFGGGTIVGEQVRSVLVSSVP